MSVVTALFDKTVYNAEEAFGASDKTSCAMRTAISDWFNLYYNKEITDTEDPCQQIPYTIVHKLKKTTFAEYEAKSKDAFTQSVLNALDDNAGSAINNAMIGGADLLKPIPPAKGKGWSFTVVNRGNYLVFGRDDEGNLTDVGIAETSTEDKYYYTLLERRTADSNGYLTIRNKLYRSRNKGNIGEPVPLDMLDKYADLEPVYTFNKPLGIGMVEMKIPIENNVDGSKDGVSVYSAATGLIHNINVNERQLSREFENGESRIVVSSDMLKATESGERKVKDHVFVALNDDPELVGITPYSPALRDQSFLARKQEYLRNVESVIGMKRGLLSEVEAVERTAKEITSSEGDYNLTIIDLQNMWEDAVHKVLKLCGTLGQLYKVPGAHEAQEDDVAIMWGNGVLYDEDKTWEDYKDMVARGMLKPEWAVGWRFKLPRETEADLAEIRKKYMPEIEQLIGE